MTKEKNKNTEVSNRANIWLRSMIPILGWITVARLSHLDNLISKTGWGIVANLMSLRHRRKKKKENKTMKKKQIKNPKSTNYLKSFSRIAYDVSAWSLPQKLENARWFYNHIYLQIHISIWIESFIGKLINMFLAWT